MTASSSRAERSEATSAELVRVARELFAERGYADVSTEEIVERAQVTRGALYHHFRDKRDLFRAVFHEVERDLVQEVAVKAFAANDPWERVLVGCQTFLDACLEQAVQRIVFIDAPAVLGWTEWRAGDDGASARGTVAFALGAAIEAGYIEPRPLEPMAHMVLGAMNEAGMLIASAEDTTRARIEVGETLVYMLEGLRRRGPRGG